MPKNPSERLKRTCELFVLNTIIDPIKGYNFVKAMIDGGYCESYAKKSGYLLRVKNGTEALINAEKAKFEAKKLWDLERIEREFIEQYTKADNAGDRTNAIRALESLMRRHGGYTQDAPNPADLLKRRKRIECNEAELRRFIALFTKAKALEIQSLLPEAMPEGGEAGVPLSRTLPDPEYIEPQEKDILDNES